MSERVEFHSASLPSRNKAVSGLTHQSRFPTGIHACIIEGFTKKKGPGLHRRMTGLCGPNRRLDTQPLFPNPSHPGFSASKLLHLDRACNRTFSDRRIGKYTRTDTSNEINVVCVSLPIIMPVDLLSSKSDKSISTKGKLPEKHRIHIFYPYRINSPFCSPPFGGLSFFPLSFAFLSVVLTS